MFSSVFQTEKACFLTGCNVFLLIFGRPRRSDITHAKRVKCLRAGLGKSKAFQVGPPRVGLYRKKFFIKTLYVKI